MFPNLSSIQCSIGLLCSKQVHKMRYFPYFLSPPSDEFSPFCCYRYKQTSTRRSEDDKNVNENCHFTLWKGCMMSEKNECFDLLATCVRSAKMFNGRMSTHCWCCCCWWQWSEWDVRTTTMIVVEQVETVIRDILGERKKHDEEAQSRGKKQYSTKTSCIRDNFGVKNSLAENETPSTSSLMLAEMKLKDNFFLCYIEWVVFSAYPNDRRARHETFSNFKTSLVKNIIWIFKF